MSKRAIAAHVAIAVLTLLAGYVGYASYGFGCFYARKPYGSACNNAEAWFDFLQFSFPAVIVLYGLWGLILATRWANRKLRVS